MPTIQTCGHRSRRKTFTFQGNTTDGITINFDSGNFYISPETITKVVNHFRGKTVFGGFSMTKPTLGGVGQFLKSLGNGLTPRHASFLCAILQHEGKASCDLDGNAVIVTFDP